MAQRISSPRFVGRSAELAVFDRLASQAASGAGCALLVSGEAGIGKSRLLSEFEARLGEANAVVLVGECVEVAEGELAFAPIVSALRPVMEDRAAVDRLEAPLRSALAALWPALGDVGGASREQLFEAVYRVLALLADSRLVVLVVEDLHWIDRSSRDLLGFLVRNARRNRLLLVATYRADELHRGHPLRPFLAELERSGQAQRLDLEPLGRAELADQLQAIVGARLAGGAIERIYARSEGNPFFAEELLATAEIGPTDDLPGSLREALLLRVEVLSEATQEVLKAAAVVGRSVDHRLLADISSLTESELLAALREATEHHVLVLTSHGLAYTFRHALLREAIYDDTFPGERLRLHRVIAHGLTANPELATTGAAAELAYHWYAAGEYRSALGASLRAADDAERMNAYEESVRHLERALAIWDRVEAPEQVAGTGRIELMLRGSELAAWAGDAERALGWANAARQAADDRAAPLVAAAAERLIGRALWLAGRGDDAIAHLAEARRLVPSHPPSVQRAEVLAEEGRMLMLAGQQQQSRERLEEALELAEALSVPRVEASSLNSLAIIYGEFGEMERAIAAGRRGLAIATEFGLNEELHRAYVNGSQALDNAGRLQEGLELGLRGIEEARRTGFDRGAGDQLRVQAGWRLARMGRFVESEAIVKPALEAATTPFSIAASKALSGHLAVERGEFASGERLLSEAWSLMQRSGGFQLIGPAQAWMVSLHLWRGELAAAERRVADGLERFTKAEPELIYNGELLWLGVRVRADLVATLDVAAAPGQRTRADSSAAEVFAALDGAVNATPGGSAPPEAIAFRALAEAELTRLRGDHDPALWLAAGERFAALDQRYRVAYTDFRAAEALCLSGATGEEAEALLRAAHEAGVSMGTEPFRQLVERFGRAHGVSLERDAAQPKEAVGDVLELLVGNRHGPRPDRLLATVMFTDIVGSTAFAAKLGDREWRAVLDQHDDLVRRTVSEFGGVMIQFVGDGTLSTFDSPGRAIACASALRDRVKTLGLEIRAGVHTGEIELRGPDIGGIAVHIGARVAAFAGPSEILVSQTVADAVTGSGIRFEDRGAHELKGVPGSWNLRAVVSVGDPVGPA